ncbi:hypothetical protein ACQVRV_00130 (plasmid) [Ralstonia pseudosolanacearum]
MTERKSTAKPVRKVRSLDEEIARASEKLQALQDRKRQQDKREREKNQKAVLELIKAERLDAVSAEEWKAALPKIKALLIVDSAKPATPAQPDQKAGTGEAKARVTT